MDMGNLLNHIISYVVWLPCMCYFLFPFFLRLTNLSIRTYSQQVICNQLFMQNKLKISFTQCTSTIIKEKKKLIFLCFSRNRRRDGSQKCNVNCSGDLIQRGNLSVLLCYAHSSVYYNKKFLFWTIWTTPASRTT